MQKSNLVLFMILEVYVFKWRLQKIVLCLHLCLWQSVLATIAMHSEGGKRLLFLFGCSLCLCMELFEGQCMYFQLGVNFKQFHSYMWSFLKLHEYHFRQLHLVFQGELKWLMNLYFIFSNHQSLIRGIMQINVKCYCSYFLNQVSKLAFHCSSFSSECGDRFLSDECLPFSYSNSATEWSRLPVRNVQQDQEMEDAEETDAYEEVEETPEVHKQSKKNIFSEQAGSYLDVSFTDLIRNSGKFPDYLAFG